MDFRGRDRTDIETNFYQPLTRFIGTLPYLSKAATGNRIGFVLDNVFCEVLEHRFTGGLDASEEVGWSVAYVDLVVVSGECRVS